MNRMWRRGLTGVLATVFLSSAGCDGQQDADRLARVGRRVAGILAAPEDTVFGWGANRADLPGG